MSAPTRDRVIQWARESGDDVDHTLPSDIDFLERFASVAYAAGQATERAKMSPATPIAYPSHIDWDALVESLKHSEPMPIVASTPRRGKGMPPDQRETIANAAAMLDGFALELRLSHASPSKPDVIPEPEVAREYFRIKRVVLELYDIAGETIKTNHGATTE